MLRENVIKKTAEEFNQVMKFIFLTLKEKTTSGRIEEMILLDFHILKFSCCTKKKKTGCKEIL